MASAFLPSLPAMFTVWPATATLTPVGMGHRVLSDTRHDWLRISFEPGLEHLTEDFAADIGGAGPRIRHDAARRRQDGNPETAKTFGRSLILE